MADLKDLQHYLDNPDDLPSDPELLAQLAEQMSGSTVADPAPEPIEKQDEKSATSGADKGTEQTVEKEVQVEKVITPEGEAPISTPDGKHTIPYSVLKTERERRQAAEDAVADMGQQLKEIQAQLAKGTEKGTEAAVEIAKDAVETMTPDELAAVKEDFPVLGKVIDGLMSTIGQLTNQVKTLSEREQTREADVRQTVAMTVQDHIDNEPVLAHLQADNPELFARAVEIDTALRNDPKFAGNMAARFAKVAQSMETIYGPFEGVAPKPQPTAKSDTPTVSKDAARKVVEAKVQATTVRPNSLSDLPSGELPASDEFESLENASPVEIGDKLLRMSQEQREKFLNRL